MLSTRNLAILADDLTGACDVAACFAASLGPVQVTISFSSQTSNSQFRTGAPQVINTQSRLLPAAQSRELLSRVGRDLAEKEVIFMKIDSALRGPVGAELEGLLEAAGPRRVIIAPAIPRLGKITRDGIQYDSGVPISEAPYAADPASPVPSAAIAEVLAQTGRLEYEIGNAETDADLCRIVKSALADRRSKLLLVGSLGLADALAAEVERRPRHKNAAAGNRILLLCGSSYQRSLEQIDHAVSHREAVVQEIASEEERSFAWPDGSLPLILRLTRPSANGADRLLEAICSLNPDALGIIGGETAYRVLNHLGATRLRVQGRVADVVAYGAIEDGAFAGRAFATKGGSVGVIDAVARMINCLRGDEAQ